MIQFNEDWKAEADNYGITLKHRKIRKKRGTDEKHEVWEYVSYHATYEQAATEVFDRKLRMCKTAEEIIEDIKETKQMIKDLNLPKK